MAAALGFGGKLGALGAALHMIFHGITKPLMFFCAGNVQQHFGTPYFRRVRGVMRMLPWTGGFFLMATLAVTGTPPFSIFQSEFTDVERGAGRRTKLVSVPVCSGCRNDLRRFSRPHGQDESWRAAS